MNVPDLKENNIFADPYILVHDLIKAQVPDPNSLRSNRPEESKRQWIFPSYPEKNDENYKCQLQRIENH